MIESLEQAISVVFNDEDLVEAIQDGWAVIMHDIQHGQFQGKRAMVITLDIMPINSAALEVTPTVDLKLPKPEKIKPPIITLDAAQTNMFDKGEV